MIKLGLGEVGDCIDWNQRWEAEDARGETENEPRDKSHEAGDKR